MEGERDASENARWSVRGGWPSGEAGVPPFGVWRLPAGRACPRSGIPVISGLEGGLGTGPRLLGELERERES